MFPKPKYYYYYHYYYYCYHHYYCFCLPNLKFGQPFGDWQAAISSPDTLCDCMWSEVCEEMLLKRLFFSQWFYNIPTKACKFFWWISYLQFGCRWLLMNAYYLSTCWYDTMWHGWWSQKPWQLPWDIFVELCHQFLLVKFTNCPVNHMPCAIPRGQMLNICSLFLVIIQVLSAEKCHHTENVNKHGGNPAEII